QYARGATVLLHTKHATPTDMQPRCSGVQKPEGNVLGPPAAPFYVRSHGRHAWGGLPPGLASNSMLHLERPQSEKPPRPGQGSRGMREHYRQGTATARLANGDGPGCRGPNPSVTLCRPGRGSHGPQERRDLAPVHDRLDCVTAVLEGIPVTLRNSRRRASVQ